MGNNNNKLPYTEQPNIYLIAEGDSVPTVHLVKINQNYIYIGLKPSRFARDINEDSFDVLADHLEYCFPKNVVMMLSTNFSEHPAKYSRKLLFHCVKALCFISFIHSAINNKISEPDI